jgi:hypothetical protein
MSEERMTDSSNVEWVKERERILSFIAGRFYAAWVRQGQSPLTCR